VPAFQWFMQHGLAETLMSYGADYADLEHAARHVSHQRVEDVMSIIPAEHRAFIRRLPPALEEDDLFVAHAMWDIYDDTTLMAARLAAKPDYRFKILWGRYGEKDIKGQKRWRRTGYFGHTPVQSYRPEYDQPLRGPSIVLLDTGAAVSPAGRLSAVCADTGECVQVHRSGEPVETT
jgi:serine/threonine protein phosphatase 1